MAKRKKKESFKWDESSGGFIYGQEEQVPEIDIQADHVRPEPPEGFAGPSGEDDVLSRIRKADEQKFYEKKTVYAGKGLESLKSRSIFVDSWSYNSLFPSVRSWSSMIAIILAPYAIRLVGARVQGANLAAMGAMLPAAIAVLVVTGILSTSRMTVSHALKDGFIHGLVLVVLAILYPWESGPNGFINVASIYLVSHIVAHGFDFHLERSNGRGWKLLFLVLFVTWVLVAIGYGAFNLNMVSVLS